PVLVGLLRRRAAADTEALAHDTRGLPVLLPCLQVERPDGLSAGHVHRVADDGWRAGATELRLPHDVKILHVVARDGLLDRVVKRRTDAEALHRPVRHRTAAGASV